MDGLDRAVFGLLNLYGVAGGAADELAVGVCLSYGAVLVDEVWFWGF